MSDRNPNKLNSNGGAETPKSPPPPPPVTLTSGKSIGEQQQRQLEEVVAKHQNEKRMAQLTSSSTSAASVVVQQQQLMAAAAASTGTAATQTCNTHPCSEKCSLTNSSSSNSLPPASASVTVTATNSANKVSSSSKVVLDRSNLRKGKWTLEEEEYAAKLIDCVSRGIIQVPEGDTLRSFLAKQLNCDPMRITKKYAGTSLLGKRWYAIGQSSSKSGASNDQNGSKNTSIMNGNGHHSKQASSMPVEVHIANMELSALERRFRLRVSTGLSVDSQNPTTQFMSSQGPIMGGGAANSSQLLGEVNQTHNQQLSSQAAAMNVIPRGHAIHIGQQRQPNPDLKNNSMTSSSLNGNHNNLVPSAFYGQMSHLTANPLTSQIQMGLNGSIGSMVATAPILGRQTSADNLLRQTLVNMNIANANSSNLLGSLISSSNETQQHLMNAIQNNNSLSSGPVGSNVAINNQPQNQKQQNQHSSQILSQNGEHQQRGPAQDSQLSSCEMESGKKALLQKLPSRAAALLPPNIVSDLNSGNLPVNIFQQLMSLQPNVIAEINYLLNQQQSENDQKLPRGNKNMSTVNGNVSAANINLQPISSNDRTVSNGSSRSKDETDTATFLSSLRKNHRNAMEVRKKSSDAKMTTNPEDSSSTPSSPRSSENYSTKENTKQRPCDSSSGGGSQDLQHRGSSVDSGKTDTLTTLPSEISGSGNGSESGSSSDDLKATSSAIDTNSDELAKTDQSSDNSGEPHSCEDDSSDKDSQNSEEKQRATANKRRKPNFGKLSSKNVADHNTKMDALNNRPASTLDGSFSRVTHSDRKRKM